MIRIARYRRIFPRPVVIDVRGEVRRQMVSLGLEKMVARGSRVAVTAGSRGINNIVLILREVIACFKDLGAEPFIVAAMGSHGGGTVEGQRQVLKEIGVTETGMGVPVLVTSDTVKLGETAGGVEVHCDLEASRADAVFLVNRVKQHTSFSGSYESGLWKMMAVGLGKVPGATAVHRQGPGKMEYNIRSIGQVFLARLPVAGGLAIVENGYDETAEIKALLSPEFDLEKDMLKRAKKLLPRLPVDRLDLLIVDEMGKNYSGTGMDVNVTGRWRIQGMADPELPQIKRLVVLDLSRESEGNANGIGAADITTGRLVKKIDFKATYLNGLTTTFFGRVAVPMTCATDREAILTALRSLSLTDESGLRAMRIGNTLKLDQFYATDALEAEIIACDSEKISAPGELSFDDEGSLL